MKCIFGPPSLHKAHGQCQTIIFCTQQQRVIAKDTEVPLPHGQAFNNLYVSKCCIGPDLCHRFALCNKERWTKGKNFPNVLSLSFISSPTVVSFNILKLTFSYGACGHGIHAILKGHRANSLKHWFTESMWTQWISFVILSSAPSRSLSLSLEKVLALTVLTRNLPQHRIQQTCSQTYSLYSIHNKTINRHIMILIYGCWPPLSFPKQWSTQDLRILMAHIAERDKWLQSLNIGQGRVKGVWGSKVRSRFLLASPVWVPEIPVCRIYTPVLYVPVWVLRGPEKLASVLFSILDLRGW